MKLALLWLLTVATLALSSESRLDDVSFDEPEDDPNELESTRYEPDSPEDDTSAHEEPSSSEGDRSRDSVHVALLAAMRRPEVRARLGEVMPIVRVMSPPQRLTLAALLTSQMLSPSAPSLSEVSAMFGVDPSAPDEVKRRVTSALLLPLSYDIARMLRGDQRGQRAHGSRWGEVLPSRRSSGDKERRRFARPPPGSRRVSHVYAEMVPPPPPRQSQQADRRSDTVDRMSAPPADHRSQQQGDVRSSQQEEGGCVLFSSTVCLEAADYPGAQIAASLRAASDAMDDSLLPGSPDLEPTPGENRRQDGGETAALTATMCASTTKMARPKKARTTQGEWKFVVNTGRHTQTLRLEVCSAPGGGCSYISDNFASECAQVYNYHRLLTWDETRGLHMDIFKVPTCCSCQVRGYANSFPPISPQGHGFLDSHAHESHAPGRVALAHGEQAYLGNGHGHHEEGTFELQGSPFQGAFAALPSDETELLKQGAAIEQQLFDRQRLRADAAAQEKRHVQRRPSGGASLPLGLVPPPGPPPLPGLEFVDNNIRRSRNQTHSDTRYQHVGISRLPSIPLQRPSPPEPVRALPNPPEPVRTLPNTPEHVRTLPTSPTLHRNAPQYQPEPTRTLPIAPEAANEQVRTLPSPAEGEPVKVNYSYHPIIDFFKSRKIESRSGEGWTPIVGPPST